MADVVVAGAGVVGLACALLLGRRGHEVLLLDRDAAPPGGSPEDEFEGWTRSGVPQAIHSHVFRARSTRVLREEARDVIDALLERGITPSDVRFGEGFEDDVALSSRRLVYEAVLRRKVESQARIELRSGVDLGGLIARSDKTVSTVTGLRTRDGEQLHADLVVDACGRRSAAPRWLREIGESAPVEVLRPFGLHYFARHYRLHTGACYPSTAVPVSQGTPYGLFVAFGGDNRTFSLAGGLSKDDPHKAALRDGTIFDRVFSAIPALSPWIDAGVPITDVHLMAGLANRRRSLLCNGVPTVRGYLLIGDASLYTNATFGQGIALGFWQVQRLAQLSSQIGQNNDALVRELEDWTDRTLGPRFEAQCVSDEKMVQTMRAGIHGAPLPEPDEAHKPLFAVAALSRQGDQLAAAALARVQNLLAEPADLLADPLLAERVHSLLATDPPLGNGSGPLPRSEFEALVL